MANASPEEIAAMRACMDAQVSYEISGAQLLKKQGNELHSQGRFKDALQKYSLANKNLSGVPATKGRTVLLACFLNMMSCYLKTRDVKERLGKEGGKHASRELNEEEAVSSSGTTESKVAEHATSQSQEVISPPKNQSEILTVPASTESLETLKDDPKSIRSFQNFLSHTDPDMLAVFSGEKANSLPSEMVKTASNVIGKMSPEELQKCSN